MTVPEPEAAELPAVVVGIGALHGWNWHCPACAITEGCRDQQDAINGRKDHLDAHRFAMTPPSSAIPVRAWWDVFAFNSESQLECPDCETLSEQFRDIYAAVRWVNDHYAACPGNGNN